MMDETFHLTPLDVRRYEFGKAIRGYDPERVNQFRDQVAEELERLSRLNQELEAKARGFHEQLRAFRERDKAINEALVSAQQLRGDIREQAGSHSLVGAGQFFGIDLNHFAVELAKVTLMVAASWPWTRGGSGWPRASTSSPLT